MNESKDPTGAVMMPKRKTASIQHKIVHSNIRYMLILITIIIAFASYGMYMLSHDILKLTMSEVANTGAKNLSNQIYIYNMSMNSVNDSPYFANPELNRNNIVTRLEAKAEEYWAFCSFVDMNGNDYMTGENQSSTEFYQRALQGDTFVSSPIVMDGGVYYIFSSAAIYNGEVVGVIYMISDYYYIHGLVTENSVGETGRTYVINTNDRVIIDEDIIAGISTSASKHLEKSASHIEFEAQAIKSTSDTGGFGFYGEDGVYCVAGYAPVANTDGWILVTTAETMEFMESFQFVLVVGILLIIVMVSLFIYLNFRSTKNFVVPITQCVERISMLAQGDIYSPVPKVNRNDESGLLAESTQNIVKSLTVVIQDITHILGSMADGDFRVESQAPHQYIGDFQPILHSFDQIIYKLNNTLTQINQSSYEVNSAAHVVSQSASSLAEGAVKQETSSSELASILENFAEQITISTQRANQVRDISLRTGEEVHKGKEQIKALVEAMSEITDSASKIVEIIKGIEEIAFQTNILALNASVEAARAGTAGRGFAVVADEVRNLSIRSTKHVEATAGLVDATMQAVVNGTKLAVDTADGMELVVQEVDESIAAIQDIAEAMEAQSGDLTRITSNMEEIVSVIANTSATSEESASTSEELSAHATNLKSMMTQFSLNRR